MNKLVKFAIFGGIGISIFSIGFNTGSKYCAETLMKKISNFCSEGGAFEDFCKDQIKNNISKNFIVEETDGNILFKRKGEK